MYLSELTLDDLLYKILEELLKGPFDLKTSRGMTSEITGVLLKLENPLARLSKTETKGTIFSGLGELLWYLSKNNKLDFISHYLSKYNDESEDGHTVYGGYGPRLFNFRGKINQFENIINLLKSRPSTRRAVIQIFDAEDIVNHHKEIPCTCTLQFCIRNNKLHMITTMRSNDAFYGLPHDVFAFTMIQEIIARTLDLELGIYNHAIGSLHLYEKDEEHATQYLNEGFQSTREVMPKMPVGDPWQNIESILEAEKIIRVTGKIDIQKMNLSSYWADLTRLLLIHTLIKRNNCNDIQCLQSDMICPVYKPYIKKRLLTIR